MTTPSTESLHPRIETVIALARLLERVEASPVAVGADQYQALVRQLKAALAQPLPGPALQAILGAHPASAELYENMHYEESGLSRSPLDRSVETEMLATQAIDRALALGSRELSHHAVEPLGGNGLGDDLAKAHDRRIHRQQHHRRARVGGDGLALRRDHGPVFLEGAPAASGAAPRRSSDRPRSTRRDCWKK